MNINPDVTKGRQGDALALISGLVLPLAFAPFDVWPLAVISIMVLMWTWWDTSPKQAFWRGWLYGLGMFGFGVSWVHVSMNRFGGMDVPLSVFVTVIFVLFLALFPATVGYLSRQMFPYYREKRAHKFMFAVPVLWVFLEWVRSWLFTGFPWLSLGYSQTDSPLAGLAPLFGVFGISFAVILTGGVLLYTLHHMDKLKFTLPGIVGLWLISGILQTVDWSKPVDDPITVSMIQGNIEQDKKWLPEYRRPQLEMYADLSRKHWDSDLVIWPETAVPAFYHQAQTYLRGIAQEARMNHSELLLGIPIYDQGARKYYNAMVAMGNEEGTYEKIHLVPFGEYLPLPKLLGKFIDFFDIPMSDFSPGTNEKPILKVAGQAAGISICYEDVFGEEVIMALPEATFLINTSNDAWFGDSFAPHQHLQIARMRALETGRYLVRATNTGVSAVIDPKGNIVDRSPQFETHVLTSEIQPMTGMPFYAIFGNSPVILFTTIGLVILFFVDRSKRSKLA